MTKHLYILSEGELDEMFYERLAERVTGFTFMQDEEFRLRHGANWKTAMASARLLISRFKHWQEKQDIAVIVAVDNDRASGHPGGRSYPKPLPKPDQSKAPRYEALQQMLFAALGSDPSRWPVKVALAVPVEMIESWVLLLLNPQREELPPFSQASQGLARLYYGKVPPPQLKDLRDEEVKARGVDRMQLFWDAAEQPLEPAMAASESLRMFVEQLQGWR
ncbi:MAG: hypothetical protein IAE77_11875 [Prosthecobacter sp.]|nr:hypothetical protein [Prosthecobacter sp.]